MWPHGLPPTSTSSSMRSDLVNLPNICRNGSVYVTIATPVTIPKYEV